MLSDDFIPFFIHFIIYSFELRFLFAHFNSSLRKSIFLGSSITDVFIWIGFSKSPSITSELWNVGSDFKSFNLPFNSHILALRERI